MKMARLRQLSRASGARFSASAHTVRWTSRCPRTVAPIDRRLILALPCVATARAMPWRRSRAGRSTGASWATVAFYVVAPELGHGQDGGYLRGSGRTARQRRGDDETEAVERVSPIEADQCEWTTRRKHPHIPAIRCLAGSAVESATSAADSWATRGLRRCRRRRAIVAARPSRRCLPPRALLSMIGSTSDPPTIRVVEVIDAGGPRQDDFGAVHGRGRRAEARLVVHGVRVGEVAFYVEASDRDIAKDCSFPVIGPDRGRQRARSRWRRQACEYVLHVDGRYLRVVGHAPGAVAGTRRGPFRWAAIVRLPGGPGAGRLPFYVRSCRQDHHRRPAGRFCGEVTS